MEFKFQRNRIDKISKEKILLEMENVAKNFNYHEFTCKEYSSNASVKHQTVLREFGNWSKAMANLKTYLSSKGIMLQQRERPKRKDYISEREIFDEMERVWRLLGHRPSKTEWDSITPRFNYNTIRKHFNGWTNACNKFIEYKMGKAIIVEQNEDILKDNSENIKTIKQEDKRDISLKLRLDVLKRDNFRCVFCGKSPATDFGVILHIDHKIPFSKGGKSTLENLQTLCWDCNLGKSNKS